MVACLCEDTQDHLIVYFTWVDYKLCESGISKSAIKKKKEWSIISDDADTYEYHQPEF